MIRVDDLFKTIGGLIYYTIDKSQPKLTYYHDKIVILCCSLDKIFLNNIAMKFYEYYVNRTIINA